MRVWHNARWHDGTRGPSCISTHQGSPLAQLERTSNGVEAEAISTPIPNSSHLFPPRVCWDIVPFPDPIASESLMLPAQTIERHVAFRSCHTCAYGCNIMPVEEFVSNVSSKSFCQQLRHPSFHHSMSPIHFDNSFKSFKRINA